MASASTSSVQKSFKYDVFLSFRGEDVRYSFISHLFKALIQTGIETYKDDEEIVKGETINTELIKSIEDSRFYIIVFSKNYASSSWCLDELVKIMECRKASEQSAYPVFYDVEPTEIRNQSGPVEEAFRKHENKEAAGKWRKALNEASNLAGWVLKNTANGDESKFIQIIVDNFFQKISSSNLSADSKLVGMETRIEKFLSSLETDADDVRMIGIWGMGGGGKTTLARAVFDRISIQFDGTAFVENVREVSGSPLYGLSKLQQQVLRSVLSKESITVSSVHIGTNMMKKMMRGRKVLIVLDDVDDIKQLEVLAGELDWFKLGSRVIVTTRDKQVLLAHRVKFINDVNLLSHTEAICLLSRNAFAREIPNTRYKELSRQVVEYADGLPLTIKVLGSMLYGQNERQWINTLERLKKIPLKATMEKLELSYNGLEEDYKEIFLEVACLLKGWDKDDAITVLESCGFFAEAGLSVLEQKSLITIKQKSIYGRRFLEMHDHIEEMGKNIVRRLNPSEPERHSRLWIREEIVDILANNSGTPATKCLTLNAHGLKFGILMQGLAKMKELRFRQVSDGTYVSEDEVRNWNLPNAIRFLRWDDYPFSSLPKTFQAKNLVGLEMCRSNIDQLWKVGQEKQKILLDLKLRFLKFTFNFKLRTLDLSVAPNLETIVLEDCYNLVEVLFHVTPNLKELHIYDCKRLERLHMPAESPKLRSLDLHDVKLRTLHLGITPNLETLRLTNCTDMVELLMPAECPKLVNIYLDNLKLRTLHMWITPNLETLKLSKCSDMVKLHMPAQCPKLVALDLVNLKFTTIHLGITPNFQMLTFNNCTDMVELQTPAECRKLEILNLDIEKLRILDLRLTPNLERLDLGYCYDLEEIRAPAKCLKKLLHLHISNCGRFKSFEFDKELDSTKVVSLSELHLIADAYVTYDGYVVPYDADETDDIGICDPGNTWPEFMCSINYKDDSASSFGNLERLISLGLGARINVDSFSDIICGLQCLRKLTLEGGIPEAPKNLDRLDFLEELSLQSTYIKTLPDNICMLKHLKSLKLGSCLLLEKLPVDIGRLECLESLIVSKCTILQDFPNSICEMRRLKCLGLSYCTQVEKLPEEIGRLECLKELDILCSGISHLPESLYGLRGLRIIGVDGFSSYVV